MNILIIGNGGREHALAWKMAQYVLVENVYVAPGNAGTMHEPNVTNIDRPVKGILGLVEAAKNLKIDLTIVGPEQPLVNGIVDKFKEEGLKIFGPTKAAAILEGSKAYAKSFMTRYNIPTAEYEIFSTVSDAEAYIRTQEFPLVIKADGLAAGKGVIIVQDHEEAFKALTDILENNIFGSGNRVVVEEFLEGEEASFMVMVDSKQYILPLATSQDHKAAYDGDTGPNTGGMGAYSPAPVITPEIHDRIMNTIVEPTVTGMTIEGIPYTGFLYVGLMIDNKGNPKVIEYNVRLGDPETQPILMRLESNLLEMCMAAVDGKLDKVKVEWSDDVALGVVMASGGYPGKYKASLDIYGDTITEYANSIVFHSGTYFANGLPYIQTDGGRVLCVCGKAATFKEAQAEAYDRILTIKWPKVQYRSDIGHKAINRK